MIAPSPAVEFKNAGKIFCRDTVLAGNYAIQDMFRLRNKGPRTRALRPKEFYALKDVSFNISKGEKIGVVGPYGSGKSTLAALIGGLIRPDEGQIVIDGKPFLINHVSTGFKPMLTVWENAAFKTALSGPTKKTIHEKCKDIIRFAGLESQEKKYLHDLEPHLVQRLGFSVSLHADADIFIFDNILGAGDEEFRERCLQRLMELIRDKTAVIICENGEWLDRLTTKVLVLEAGCLSSFGEKKIYFPAPASDPKPKLRGLISQILINGVQHPYSSTSLLLKPESLLRIEFDFVPCESFVCDDASLCLHAPFQKDPLAVKRLKIDELSGLSNGGSIHFQADKCYLFKFSLKVPRRQKGGYGLALTLRKKGCWLSKRDCYKITRFGLLNNEDRGSAAILEVQESLCQAGESCFSQTIHE